MLKSCILVLVVTIVQSERLFYEPRMIKVVPAERPQHTVEFSGEKPDFCNNLDCPEYKVIEKTKDYELREYAASNWVATRLTNIEYKTATVDMFYKLFYYIQGNNTRGEKIAMTAPVVTRLIPGAGPACEDDFKMSFYLSNKIKDPPAPTDSTVSIDHVPVFRVYVRQFGGYMFTLKQWVMEAQKLQAAIKDVSKYETKEYFTAGYNSPVEIFHRHNEIWFLAK